MNMEMLLGGRVFRGNLIDCGELGWQDGFFRTRVVTLRRKIGDIQESGKDNARHEGKRESRYLEQLHSHHP